MLAARRQLQDRSEAAPDPFIRYEQPKLLKQSRQAVAELIRAPLSTVLLVANATTALNVVLRNLVFKPKDKIIMFATVYGACEKSVISVCETTAAESVTIPLAYPVSDASLLNAFESTVVREKVAGNNVKLALFDTISSMPGLRVPFQELVCLCKKHNILSCIDGAHGVGHIPLDMSSLDPDFFFSNLHKWTYTPRGCALFYVPLRNQHQIRTSLPTSHGFVASGETSSANPLPPGAGFESAFVQMFEFVGSGDITPFLSVPAAIQFRKNICGGEDKIMQYCADLVARGAVHVAEELGTEVMQNEEGTLHKDCAMANVRLPLDAKQVALDDRGVVGVVAWTQEKMTDEYNGFVPTLWHGGHWWVRLSAQVWLDMDDFDWAARTLADLCDRVRRGEHVQAKPGHNSKL